MSYLFRSTGQVLGVSLSAALVQSTLTRDLPRRITGPGAEHAITIIRQSIDQIRHLAPVYRDAAVASYGIALQNVFYANLAMSIVTFGLVMLIKEEEL
jgi:hypothetical protein